MCVDLNKVILSDTTHTLATLISFIQQFNASEKPYYPMESESYTSQRRSLLG